MLKSCKGLLNRHAYKNPAVLRTRSLKAILWVLRWVFILALCYLFLFPVWYMFSTAFQDPASVNDPSVIFIPKTLSLTSIREMIDMLNYWRSAFLTLSIAVTGTLASLVSCSMVAYGFARFKFKGQNVLFALVILTLVIPPQTILPSMVLNFQFFDFGGLLSLLPGDMKSINLMDTIWTFLLPALFATGLRSGLFIFIFRQFFQGLPKDLEEAARIDGCSALRTYVRIIVPLAVPAFITVALFSFIWHWNDLYSSTMYFTSDVRPLMPLLNDLDQLLKRTDLSIDSYTARTYKSAAVLLTILPPLVLYLFTQKYFTESIERSGIVG